MIYTVTLNPSIDYIVHVGQFKIGELNKMDRDAKYPGGKGINVSRILNELGHETKALGFLGGFTGQFIEDHLKANNILTDFISISDDTRINIKLKSEVETEINGLGPNITNEEADRLLKQVENISDQDTIVFSGSKPPSLPDDYYIQLVKKAKQKKIDFIMDTTGQDLQASLALHPLLVKPNIHELAELFKVTFDNTKDVIPYGKKLIEMGAQHAIVSMGGDGALIFTKEDVYHGISPKGKVKNTVGAGDSMIAGFIANYTETKDPIEAFKLGIASGSATAFSNDLAKKEDIINLLDQIKINKL